ncbi:MAG: hypothetical protein WCY37_02585 [Candidatus Dojkabacteria bacterium]
MEKMSQEIDSLPPIYEAPREFFVLEPPLDLEMHSMREVNEMCTKEYYNHKRGCPNFGSREGCPPNLKHITKIVDISTLHFFLVQFDFEEYIRRKMERSPGRTNRDYANQRQWQGHLKSQLKKRWKEVDQYNYPNYILHLEPESYCRNPEAHGINVIRTLENHGFEVDWCQENQRHEFVQFPKYMYQVFIFGQELPQIDQV